MPAARPPRRPGRFLRNPRAADSYALPPCIRVPAGSGGPGLRRFAHGRWGIAVDGFGPQPGTAAKSLHDLEFKLHSLASNDVAKVVLPESPVSREGVHQKLKTEPSPKSE